GHRPEYLTPELYAHPSMTELQGATQPIEQTETARYSLRLMYTSAGAERRRIGPAKTGSLTHPPEEGSCCMYTLTLFLFGLTAFAQTAGIITGTVSNLPGEAVANAPVQARNIDTKAVFLSTSSKQGVYSLTELPPGTYEVSVALPGF